MKTYTITQVQLDAWREHNRKHMENAVRVGNHVESLRCVGRADAYQQIVDNCHE